MKKYSVDHVCLATAKFEETVALFQNVFGMELVKQGGAAPTRKIWLDGGIQINEASDFDPKGGMDHVAIDVPASEREAVFAKAAEYGCTQVPGQTPCQWIYMPEGQMIELTDVTKSFNASK